MNVKIDDLSAAIARELNTYNDEIAEKIKAEAKDDANELAEAIRNDARSKYGGSGNYAKGWKAEKDYEGANNVRYIVKNKTNWQLTHLLEFGHAKWLWGKRTGGKVDGHEHIRPNADRIVRKFEEAVERIIKGG